MARKTQQDAEENSTSRRRTRQQTAGEAARVATATRKPNARSKAGNKAEEAPSLGDVAQHPAAGRGMKQASTAEDAPRLGDVAQQPAAGRSNKKKTSGKGRKRAWTSGEAPADSKKPKTSAAGSVFNHERNEAATEGEDVTDSRGALVERDSDNEAAAEDDDAVVHGLETLHVDEANEAEALDSASEEGHVTDVSDVVMKPGSAGSLSDEEEEASAGAEEQDEQEVVVPAAGGRKKGKAAARNVVDAMPTFVATSESEVSDATGITKQAARSRSPPPREKSSKKSKVRVQSDDTDSGASRAELQPTVAKKAKPKPTPVVRASGAAQVQVVTTVRSSTSHPAAFPPVSHAAHTPLDKDAQTPAASKTKSTAKSATAKAKAPATPGATTPAAVDAQTPAASKTKSTAKSAIAKAKAPATPGPTTPAAAKTKSAAKTKAPMTHVPATPAAANTKQTATPAPSLKPRRVAMHAGPGPKRKNGGAPVEDDSNAGCETPAIQEPVGDEGKLEAGDQVVGGHDDEWAAEADDEEEEDDGREDEKEGVGAGIGESGASSAGGGGYGHASEWPAFTNLVYADGKVSTLNSQTEQVHQVITEANTKQIPRTLCWRHAMPATPLIYDIVREALINAAVECGQVDIEQRLQADKSYARVMGSISTQGRCSTFRSESYKNAMEVNFYELYKVDKLKTAEKIADAVAGLFKLPMVTFTYSGDPLLQKYEKDEPFCHPAIAAVLRVLFFSKKRYPMFPEELFKSSVNKGEEAAELELPMAMVAYAATIVGAWLKQYQSGTFIKVQFSTTIFSGMYNTLLSDLKSIKAANLLGFHSIMHDLYNQVMGISVEENVDPAAAGVSSAVDFKNVGIKKKGIRRN
ncbi:hypothetical protein FA95DRAFT_1612914 [Auriscalpium vulgare]|uniref:Uncharacterized protein n=1 Tax=Auriscalpium vulgare TaxID=40419 RepID=A0ACB8R571_9AGAM|nr:hypothetical protein FA95DRAFT_1612914 [Auriscalpium vulgare]